MAVWDAVQKACCTAERKSEIDTAFEGLSNLLGSYNNDSFGLFIERYFIVLFLCQRLFR